MDRDDCRLGSYKEYEEEGMKRPEKLLGVRYDKGSCSQKWKEGSNNCYDQWEAYHNWVLEQLPSEEDIFKIINNPPLIQPIIDNILQPVKIPEWQVKNNRRGLAKAISERIRGK